MAVTIDFIDIEWYGEDLSFICQEPIEERHQPVHPGFAIVAVVEDEDGLR